MQTLSVQQVEEVNGGAAPLVLFAKPVIKTAVASYKSFRTMKKLGEVTGATERQRERLQED